MERVKRVHSVGGFGSQGYGYDWKIEEARKNLLRTHTTAVSARMLYSLAKVCFSLLSLAKFILRFDVVMYRFSFRMDSNQLNTSALIEFSVTRL